MGEPEAETSLRLFRAVCLEVCRRGTVGSAENRLLHLLRTRLAVRSAAATQVFKEAKEEESRGGATGFRERERVLDDLLEVVGKAPGRPPSARNSREPSAPCWVRTPEVSLHLLPTRPRLAHPLRLLPRLAFRRRLRPPDARRVRHPSPAAPW